MYFYSKASKESWSKAEVKALVAFIVSRGNMQWPMHHRMEFWESAALFVKTQAGHLQQRSGNFMLASHCCHNSMLYAGLSCRFKVVKWLRKKFDDPKSAEIFYLSSVSVGVQVSLSVAVQNVDVGVQTESREMESSAVDTTLTQSFSNAGVQADLCPTDLQAISVAFSKYCREELDVEVCNDFLQVSSLAIVLLKASNRSNMVYNLAKNRHVS